jgi:hypothetical protein
MAERTSSVHLWRSHTGARQDRAARAPALIPPSHAARTGVRHLGESRVTGMGRG